MNKYLASFLLLVSLPIYSRVMVEVGLPDTQQPPFFIDASQGLALDITHALNDIQQDYLFVSKLYPIKRLHSKVQGKSLHIVALQDEIWFPGLSLRSSACVLYESKERFIALKTKAKDQTYFDSITTKKILAVAGFHYNFANNINDEEWLKGQFDIAFSSNQYVVIQGILRGRGDIGITSSASLAYLAVTNPQAYNKLLISERVDRHNQRRYLLFQNSPIDSDKLDQLLAKLYRSGVLATLFSKYGLPTPNCALDAPRASADYVGNPSKQGT
ncbi:hypothetical protein K6Y31_17695 [Motilimonas cestriensis]|uniref:Uncharacterized protein n=1 Tax=Motilimonas cestriensis TaxID=2742685 RepID=A0ABS8WED1_9GAMM|nr:hypothetical protein [Motilimonas cestriensis]MCE2596625.1 hypothetical protein [Motilimonas cestriensis]